MKSPLFNKINGSSSSAGRNDYNGDLDNKLTTKGMDHDNKNVRSSYQKTHDADGREVIMVKGLNDGVVSINLCNIRSTVERLCKHADTKLSDLKGETSEDLNSIMQLYQILHNSEVHDSFLDVVMQACSKVNDVKVGTVGAYLKGCFVPTGLNDNQACDPRCTGSISPSLGTEGWSHCDKLVLLYQGAGKFKTMNTLTGVRQGYIFVDENVPFSGKFSAVEIRKLKQFGLDKAAIVRMSSGGKYQEQSEMVNIDSLGAKTKVNGIDNGVSFNNGSNGNGNGGNGSNVLLWIIIIIIIIIVIIAIVAAIGAASGGGSSAWSLNSKY